MTEQYEKIHHAKKFWLAIRKDEKRLDLGRIGRELKKWETIAIHHENTQEQLMYNLT